MMGKKKNIKFSYLVDTFVPKRPTEHSVKEITKQIFYCLQQKHKFDFVSQNKT